MAGGGGVDTRVAVATIAEPVLLISAFGLVDGQVQGLGGRAVVGVNNSAGVVAAGGVHSIIVVSPSVGHASSIAEFSILMCVDGQVQSMDTFATVSISVVDIVDVALGERLGHVLPGVAVASGLGLGGTGVGVDGQVQGSGTLATIGISELDSLHTAFGVGVILTVGSIPSVSVALGDRLGAASVGVDGQLQSLGGAGGIIVPVDSGAAGVGLAVTISPSVGVANLDNLRSGRSIVVVGDNHGVDLLGNQTSVEGVEQGVFTQADGSHITGNNLVGRGGAERTDIIISHIVVDNIDVVADNAVASGEGTHTGLGHAEAGSDQGSGTGSNSSAAVDVAINGGVNAIDKLAHRHIDVENGFNRCIESQVENVDITTVNILLHIGNSRVGINIEEGGSRVGSSLLGGQHTVGVAVTVLGSGPSVGAAPNLVDVGVHILRDMQGQGVLDGAVVGVNSVIHDGVDRVGAVQLRSVEAAMEGVTIAILKSLAGGVHSIIDSQMQGSSTLAAIGISEVNSLVSVGSATVVSVADVGTGDVGLSDIIIYISRHVPGVGQALSHRCLTTGVGVDGEVQRNDAVATGNIRTHSGVGGVAGGVGSTVDPSVAVASHLVVNTGVAVVDGQVQRHNAVATGHIGTHHSIGSVAGGVGSTVDPSVSVASDLRVNTSITAVDGQVEGLKRADSGIVVVPVVAAGSGVGLVVTSRPDVGVANSDNLRVAGGTCLIGHHDVVVPFVGSEIVKLVDTGSDSVVIIDRVGP